MPPKTSLLTPHCQKVLSALKKSGKPLTAYELLDKLHKYGIKAPPTVYRALDTLIAQGLVHRIVTLGAFIACHDHDHGSEASHAHFAVCRDCGSVEEIHYPPLARSVKTLAGTLQFHIERQMLELVGLCRQCAPVAKGA